MPDPAYLRDSMQIVLPHRALADVQADLQAQFTVTIQELDDHAQVIASPVVITEITDFLTRRDVSVA